MRTVRNLKKNFYLDGNPFHPVIISSLDHWHPRPYLRSAEEPMLIFRAHRFDLSHCEINSYSEEISSEFRTFSYRPATNRILFCVLVKVLPRFFLGKIFQDSARILDKIFPRVFFLSKTLLRFLQRSPQEKILPICSRKLFLDNKYGTVS